MTDRCNFRCTYCMPKEVFGREYQFLDRREILSFEEITRLARVFVAQGVEKVRLTGGEPTLRRGLPKLVEMLREIEGVKDLTLTTNGSRLAEMARELKDAGLDRVTVSLDSLDDAVFRAMNDVDFPVSRVLEGIEEAARVGLTPVKVNMVVKRGVNEHTIVDFARHFKGSGHIVRFIEYMDVGNSNGWRLDDVVTAAEIVAMIDREMPLEPLEPQYRGEVAEALPLPRRQRRDRRDRLGLAAVLRRLHAGAHLRGRALVHVPLRRHRPRPAQAVALGEDGRGDRGVRGARVVAAGRPLLGAAGVGDAGAGAKPEMSYIGG